MVPRADIIAVQRHPARRTDEAVRHRRHSRLVVYDDTLDDPVGMVHIRDLISFMTANARGRAEKDASAKSRCRPTSISAIDLAMTLAEAKITRKMLFVPPSMRHRSAGAHAGDPHPSCAGDRRIWRHRWPVSIEDIVEQIVGDIADEHDEDEPPTTCGRRTVPSLPTRAPSRRCRLGDRPGFRRRRRWRGSRHARRLSGRPRSAACRCAAKLLPAPATSSSRCSMPIRAGSSACASPAQGAPLSRHARSAAAKPRRRAARRRPATIAAIARRRAGSQ